MGNGIKLACNQEVVDIEKRDGFFYVRERKIMSISSRMVINCAGNQAYEISKISNSVSLIFHLSWCRSSMLICFRILRCWPIGYDSTGKSSLAGGTDDSWED